MCALFTRFDHRLSPVPLRFGCTLRNIAVFCMESASNENCILELHAYKSQILKIFNRNRERIGTFVENLEFSGRKLKIYNFFNCWIILPKWMYQLFLIIHTLYAKKMYYIIINLNKECVIPILVIFASCKWIFCYLFKNH